MDRENNDDGNSSLSHIFFRRNNETTPGLSSNQYRCSNADPPFPVSSTLNLREWNGVEQNKHTTNVVGLYASQVVYTKTL